MKGLTFCLALASAAAFSEYEQGPVYDQWSLYADDQSGKWRGVWEKYGRDDILILGRLLSPSGPWNQDPEKGPVEPRKVETFLDLSSDGSSLTQINTQYTLNEDLLSGPTNFGTQYEGNPILGPGGALVRFLPGAFHYFGAVPGQIIYEVGLRIDDARVRVVYFFNTSTKLWYYTVIKEGLDDFATGRSDLYAKTTNPSPPWNGVSKIWAEAGATSPPETPMTWADSPLKEQTSPGGALEGWVDCTFGCKHEGRYLYYELVTGNIRIVVPKDWAAGEVGTIALEWAPAGGSQRLVAYVQTTYEESIVPGAPATVNFVKFEVQTGNGP